MRHDLMRLPVIAAALLLSGPLLAGERTLSIDMNDVTVALVEGRAVNVATGTFKSAPSYRSGDVAYWRAAGLLDGQSGTGAWMKAVPSPNIYYDPGVTDPGAPLMMVRVNGKLYYRWSEYLPTPEKRRESGAYWQAVVEARQKAVPQARFKLMPFGKEGGCTPYGCIMEVSFN